MTGPSDTEYAISFFVRTGKSVVVWETNWYHSWLKISRSWQHIAVSKISRSSSDHQHMISFIINKLLISKQENESTSISVRYKHEYSRIL